MLAQLAHFLWHAPGALRARGRATSQGDLYDEIMERGEDAGMARWREELVHDLRGEVLEIGAGTGFMFRHYPQAARVTALEPDPAFAVRAEPRAKQARARVEQVVGRAEALPFPRGRFDAAVVALVLCSVEDPGRVLAELARVVRPGGEVRLIEHVVSARPLSAALMRLADPVWLRLNRQGCHMDRDTVGELSRAGYDLEEVQSFRIYTPGIPAFPMRWIRARPPRERG